MKDLLLEGVRKFLESKKLSGSPLLLGYSGGPDSKALLHLLLSLRHQTPLELHLAHVDHGWRQESKKEAALLLQEAQCLGLVMHVKSLTMHDFSPSNLEEQARWHRLAFFSKIYEEIGAQALLLGHHADDQAETVLKRIFEGASLPALSGLSQETRLVQMTLWRPLLPFPKTTILEWLAKNALPFISDPTNEEGTFLRGKMRKQLLPFLEESFGKGISSNLCRLGKEAQELKGYFELLNQPLLERITEEGVLDLNPYLPLPSLQLRCLFREWARSRGVVFSYSALEGVVQAVLRENKERKKFCSGYFTFETKNRLVSLINKSNKN